MSKSISRIFVLTKRNIKEIIREPLSIIFMIMLPLLLEVLFYFIFHNLTKQFEMSYLAPSIVAFSEAFLTLFTGLLIAVDRNSSFLTRLYVSKAKPYEFILGYAFSIIPLTLIQTVLFFLVGGIFDVKIFGFGMLLAIPLSFITSLFFIACGILFGSICNEKSIGGISSIIICGQSVLSGMWFPTDTLSGGIKVLMEVLPFRNVTLLFQNLIIGIGNPFNDFIKPLLIVVAYTVVLFIISILVFKKKMNVK